MKKMVQNKKIVKEFTIFTEKFKINELLEDKEYFKYHSNYNHKYELYHFNSTINKYVFLNCITDDNIDKLYKEAEKFIYDKNYYFLIQITE